MKVSAPSRCFSSSARSGRVWRVLAFILLVVQIGLIAHRIEHYLIPDQMECGEDACTAFAPGSGATAISAVIAVPLFIVFAVRFWTVRTPSVGRLRHRLGFTAHAPPA